MASRVLRTPHATGLGRDGLDPAPGGHAIMHNLPENYHSYVPVEAEATSLDYYGDWPGQMGRQIEESLVRAAQDGGPPDWEKQHMRHFKCRI